MKRTTTIKAHLIALAMMFLGSSAVFAAVIYINQAEDEKNAADRKSAVTFKVEPIKPKTPEPPKQKKREEKKKQEQRRLIDPLPSLGSGLSGVALNLPELGDSRLSDVSGSLLDEMGGVTMSEDAVDSRPRPRMRGPVNYPESARKNGTTGYVTLNLLIGSDGLVKKVRVLDARPAGVFEQAAMAAVDNWVFEPATYKGRPVEVWARQTIRFDLN